MIVCFSQECFMLFFFFIFHIMVFILDNNLAIFTIKDHNQMNLDHFTMLKFNLNFLKTSELVKYFL